MPSDWLPLALFMAFSLAGVASLVVTSSGTVLILIGAAVYAAMTGFTPVGVPLLIWVAALYAFGELLEYVVTIATVKRMGASKAAAIGAAVGGFVGAVLGIGMLGIGLLFGTLAGLFIGGFTGEWIATRQLRQSLWAGVAGLASRIAVTVFKLVVAIAMIVMVALPIVRERSATVPPTGSNLEPPPSDIPPPAEL